MSGRCFPRWGDTTGRSVGGHSRRRDILICTIAWPTTKEWLSKKLADLEGPAAEPAKN
jgi:hypothetical protein